MQIKHFLKQCKNANYTRKIKSLVEKVEENSKVINSERLKCGIPLTDEAGIAAWELSMKSKGTPLGSFYLSWLKIHQQNLTRKVADTVKVICRKNIFLIFSMFSNKLTIVVCI